MDWRFATFILSCVQFFGGILLFCILKFNDLKHLERNLEKLEVRQENLEKVQSERHLANIGALGKLANEVAYLTGRHDAEDKIIEN